MLYIYRMYKFVKLVNEQNTKLVEKAVLGINQGKDEAVENFRLIAETEAIDDFSGQKILLKKVGVTVAAQTSMAALKNKYLEPADPNGKPRRLRVTHLKGLRLLDGIPFLRPGLWKAWHKEHGWLIPALVGGFGLGVGGALRFLWDLVF